ncbi:MAG: DegV family protein [Acholeplasmataceae bacterium]|nr:DegV family protein [Acholeplasmataceae bacterium]
MKIAVLTDSGSNLQPEYLKKHKNLFVVPLMIIADGKSYRDQKEITAEEVYAQIDEKDFSTSLPEIGDLKQTIEQIKKEGYTDLLVINISSGLSGTYNAFRIELEATKGINITQYDTKTIGAGQGYLVEQAIELADKNVEVKDILKALMKQRKDDSLALYTIGTLKYLKKGGRIGKVEGTIGDLLHLKPVISVDLEGVYVTLAKGFGLKRSLMTMKNLFVEKFQNFKIDLTVHYGNGKEKAEELAQMMMKVLNVRTLTLSPLTPVLGIHTGPEFFSYCGRKVEE